MVQTVKKLPAQFSTPLTVSLLLETQDSVLTMLNLTTAPLAQKKKEQSTELALNTFWMNKRSCSAYEVKGERDYRNQETKVEQGIMDLCLLQI